MQKIFECLESTVNKSILEKFQNFLKQYPDVDKWFMCSDYCIGDKLSLIHISEPTRRS